MSVTTNDPVEHANIEKVLSELRQAFSDHPALGKQALPAAQQRAEHWSMPGQEVHINSYGGIVPFQVSGEVDNHPFYLRSRWEIYDLHLAQPGGDPVAADSIASGAEEHISGTDYTFPPETVIDFIVTTIRSHLRAENCSHRGSSPRDWYCRSCGTALGGCGLPD